MGFCRANFAHVSRTNHVKSPDAWVLHGGGVFYSSNEAIKTVNKMRSGDTLDVEIDLELREARFKYNDKLFQTVANIDKQVRGLVCFGGQDQQVELLSRPFKKKTLAPNGADSKKTSFRNKSTFASVKGSRSVVLMLLSVIRSILDLSSDDISSSVASASTSTQKCSPKIDIVAVVAATEMLNLLVIRSSGSNHTDINATTHPDLKKAIRILACKLLDSEVVCKHKNVRDVVLNLFTTIFEQIFVPKQQLDFIINLMKRQRTSSLSRTESGLLTRLITQLLNPAFTATVLRHSPSIPNFFECLLELWRARARHDRPLTDVESKSTGMMSLSTAVLRVYHTLIAKMSMKIRFIEAFTVHPFDDDSLWLTFSKILDLSLEELTTLCKSGASPEITGNKEDKENIECLGNCSGMLLPLLLASLCNLFDRCRYLNEDSVCVKMLTPRIPQLLTILKRAFRQYLGPSASWPEFDDHVLNNSPRTRKDADACVDNVRLQSSMSSLAFWIFNMHNLTVVLASRFCHLLFHFNVLTHDEIRLREVLQKPILQQPKCSLDTQRNEVQFFKGLLKSQQNIEGDELSRFDANRNSTTMASSRISSNSCSTAPSESAAPGQHPKRSHHCLLFEALEKVAGERNEVSPTTPLLVENSDRPAVNHAIEAIFLATLYHSGLYEEVADWMGNPGAPDITQRELPHDVILTWKRIQAMRALMLVDNETIIHVDEDDLGYWGNHHPTIKLTEENAIATKIEGSPDYSGAISANGIYEGETSWNIRLLDASEQIYIGVGFADIPCDQGLQRGELRNRVWYYRNRGQLRCGDKTIHDTGVVCKDGDLLTVTLDLERKVVTFTKNEHTLIGTIGMDGIEIQPSERAKLHAIAILDGVGDAVKMETNGFRVGTQTQRPSLEVVSGTIEQVNLKTGDNFQVSGLVSK